MIRAVIIDDEEHSVELLKGMIQRYCPEISICGTADKVASGVSLINREEPGLIFLDIEMPGGSGFDLLDQVSFRNFKVIFITGYDQYAIKAIKYSALDFLQKPLVPEDLKAATGKMLDEGGSMDHGAGLTYLKELIKTERASSMMLPNMQGFVKVELDDIIQVLADGKYSKFYLLGARIVTVSKNIGYYEEILPPDHFCRVHHASIVNTRHIIHYEKGRGGLVKMREGHTVYISARKRNSFLERFMK